VPEGVERGDSSAMSQNSSLMSGVDCLLGTSSSSTLHWLSSPFRGGVNESRFTSSPALSLEIPKSGTLDLRSVAERRRFWFLKAVLKLSSLCKAAAATAREDPSAILATK